jgi:acylphosphatase
METYSTNIAPSGMVFVMKEIEAIVSGKVTMVNFRHFTKQKAGGLGIFGFVENTRDFGVRVVAQGLEGDLEKFIKHLHKGPFNAKVRNIEVTFREPTERFSDFAIIYS